FAPNARHTFTDGKFSLANGNPLMRTLWILTFVATSLLGSGLVGCSKQPAPRPVVVVEAPPEPVVQPMTATTSPPPPASGTAPEADTSAQPLLIPVAAPEPSAQEKYDAALLEALNYVAEKKYAEALVSLGAAKAAQNTEQVQREIDKVKELVAQRLAADQITQDIKTVLHDGKAEDAAKLATMTLQQYGSGDHADQLTL